MNFQRTFVILLCLVLVACGPSATASPAVPTKEAARPAPTKTVTPVPTTTLTPSPSPIPPTPTLGPPAIVANLFVKKSKCVVYKPTVAMPYYHADIYFLLGWDDLPNEDGYWLYRDGNRVAELPSNTTEYTDVFQPRKPGKVSAYYLVAYNNLGESRTEVLGAPNPC